MTDSLSRFDRCSAYPSGAMTTGARVDPFSALFSHLAAAVGQWAEYNRTPHPMERAALIESWADWLRATADAARAGVQSAAHQVDALEAQFGPADEILTRLADDAA